MLLVQVGPAQFPWPIVAVQFTKDPWEVCVKTTFLANPNPLLQTWETSCVERFEGVIFAGQVFVICTFAGIGSKLKEQVGDIEVEETQFSDALNEELKLRGVQVWPKDEQSYVIGTLTQSPEAKSPIFFEQEVAEHVPVGKIGLHWDNEFNVVEIKLIDFASPFPLLQTLEMVWKVVLLKEVGHVSYVVVINGWAFKSTQTLELYWFENEIKLGNFVTTVITALLQTVFVQKL